eukprot:1227239-Prymnesium_polylepis.1
MRPATLQGARLGAVRVQQPVGVAYEERRAKAAKLVVVAKRARLAFGVDQPLLSRLARLGAKARRPPSQARPVPRGRVHLARGDDVDERRPPLLEQVATALLAQCAPAVALHSWARAITCVRPPPHQPPTLLA